MEHRFLKLHLPDFHDSLLLRIAIPFVFTLIALAVRNAFLADVLGQEGPFLLFYISTIVSAWMGGFVSGLLATALGAFISTALHLNVRGDMADQAELLFFVLAGISISAIFGFLHRSEQRLLAEGKMLKEEVARRTEVQMKLEETDKNRDRFLSTLAHEMRTPLGTATNILQLVEGRGGPTPQMLDILKRQMRVMTRLVDDVLESTRAAENKLTFEMQPIQLSVILKDTVEGMRQAIENKGHRLHLDIRDDSLWVEGDALRLIQVFTNILTNAVKYTPEHGEIRISAFQEEGSAVVRFRDNGIGIPKETLPRLFDMYFQTEVSRKHAQGGLGIGLPLVKRLLQRHGGDISGTSEGVGQGSEFTIRLPLTDKRDAFESPDASRPSGGATDIHPTRH